MKIASLSEIKSELKVMPHEELIKVCLRIAGFKKENKELLNYLIFESGNEAGYRETLKNEIEEEFVTVNTKSVYLAKKGIRRILRMVSKHIKYSGSKQTEVELLIFFCQQMRSLNMSFQNSKVLINLYNRQVQNIQKALLSLEEDLQYDYKRDVPIPL